MDVGYAEMAPAWPELDRVGLTRAHFGHNYPISRLSRDDSILLKPLSDGGSGKGQNPQNGNTRRFLRTARISGLNPRIQILY